MCAPDCQITKDGLGLLVRRNGIWFRVIGDLSVKSSYPHFIAYQEDDKSKAGWGNTIFEAVDNAIDRMATGTVK
jgi:hypothetical protein